MRSADGPLFFDDRWRLRYAPDELLRFGFSAAELLEQGLPENGAWYPVAAPAPDGGLWVELSPGRVVELSGALLHSPATGASALDDLGWHLFAPGDEVRLELRRDRGSAPLPRPPRLAAGPARLVRAPPRAARAEPGRARTATAGSGARRADLVWLTAPRPPTCLAAAEQPHRVVHGTLAPGDVVLLRAGDDGYGIAGAPRYAVPLAEEWATPPGCAQP